MNLNKRMTIVLVIGIVLIICIPTTIIVVRKHKDNLYQVVNKKIISAAKDCYYSDKCEEDKIYLSKLYELEYLTDRVSDPVTKEYYSEKSYVKRKNNKFEFIKVDEKK